MIALSAYAVYERQPWLAGFLGTGVLVSVVYAFMRIIGDGAPTKSDRDDGKD